MKKHDAAKAYRCGYEDGFESGYEHGRASTRMTDDNRKLLFDALDALRETRGVTVDQIVLEVLDYARKTDTDKR